MNKRPLAIVLGLAASLTAAPVLAERAFGSDLRPRYGHAGPVYQTGGYYGSGHVSDAGHVAYAEVLRVEPLTRTVQVATPVQQCYEETVAYAGGGYGHGRHHGRSYTAPIVGGIVGGLVGNQFGGGTGQTLLTVAGAVLGASIGNDHSRRHAYRGGHRHHRSYPVVEQRCHTTQRYHEEVRNDGYLVDYRYNGRVYTTRLDHHPGRRLRVDVQVTPVE